MQNSNVEYSKDKTDSLSTNPRSMGDLGLGLVISHLDFLNATNKTAYTAQSINFGLQVSKHRWDASLS